MREDQFYELFGRIDPEIIAAADKPVPFRKKRGFKLMLIAAVLAAVMLATPIVGALTMAGSYKAAHPEFEGNTSQALDAALQQSGIKLPEIGGGGLLNIDWAALPEVISPDGGIDWQGLATILRGEEYKPDPSGDVFKSVLLDDGTMMITEYVGNSEQVTVPDTVMGKTVTVIGEKAFCANTAIVDVKLPSSVTTIKDSAFAGCTNLVSVMIPQNLQIIEQFAFTDCTSLCELYVENFASSSTEAGANLPYSLHTLGDQAFSHCRSLESVVIRPTLKNWGAQAFVSSGLQEVRIMEGVTEIPEHAFYGTNLAEVSIPSSVTKIGTGAFALCSNLQTVTLHEGLESIGQSAFTGTSISSITIPSTVTVIEAMDFAECRELEQVIFAGNAPGVVNDPLYGKDEGVYLPDYTVYYRLGAEGFGSEWLGHTCELAAIKTAQYVLDKVRSSIPMYNVRLLGETNRYTSEDEVTVIDSISEYKMFASVLGSGNYSPAYFREYAIVLIKVKHSSSEQVLGVAGLCAKLYTTGGLYYFEINPVVIMDTPKATSDDEYYSLIAVDVKRSDIRTDDVIRTGQIYVYNVGEFASGGSNYHESFINDYK